MARVLDASSAGTGTPTSASARRTCAGTSTRRRSSPTTRSAPSTSSTASTSAAPSGASSRASPTAPTSTSPRTPRRPAPTCRTSTRRPASAGRRTSSSRRPASTARCSPSCSTRTPRTRRPTPRASWRSAPCCASTRASRRSRSRCCRCRATPQLSPKAKGLAADLRQNWNIEFDDAGAIGRRYRRQDEIGTPFCVTVDFDTLDDNAVTVRERDTMTQERVSLDQIEGYLGAAPARLLAAAGAPRADGPVARCAVRAPGHRSSFSPGSGPQAPEDEGGHGVELGGDLGARPLRGVRRVVEAGRWRRRPRGRRSGRRGRRSSPRLDALVDDRGRAGR